MDNFHGFKQALQIATPQRALSCESLHQESNIPEFRSARRTRKESCYGNLTAHPT